MSVMHLTATVPRCMQALPRHAACGKCQAFHPMFASLQQHSCRSRSSLVPPADCRPQHSVAANGAHPRSDRNPPAGLQVPAEMPRRDILLGAALASCCTCPACSATALAAASGEGRGGLYDRFYAFVMARLSRKYETLINTVKQDLFAELFADTGIKHILEVGLGTGPNLAFYPKDRDGLHVTGVDPNPCMASYAREAADNSGLSEQQLDLRLGVAENLPVPSQAFDAAVVTLTLCSVQYVAASLQELARVLRPGGKYLFVEHVIAPKQRRLLRLTQHALTPLQSAVGGNCHLDRDTLGAIRTSGLFTELDVREFDLQVISVLAPHIAGIVQVADADAARVLPMGAAV